MCSSRANPSFTYDLDFEFTTLNRILNKSFTITNLSFNNSYRFKISSLDAVMFIPKAGHLKPMGTKTVNINVHVVRIEYLEPATADTSWDDRQDVMHWTAEEDAMDEYEGESGSKMKLVVQTTEPEIIVKSDITFIRLSVTAKADYSIYLTTMKEVIFPNTFLNEQSTAEFEVLNGGIVPLQISWIITDFDQDNCSLRSTCSSTSLTSLFSSSTRGPDSTGPYPFSDVQLKCPFSITPQSTSIPVNLGQRFQVTFAPLEAGYYTLRLISNIVSLSPSLTEIDVSIMGRAILPEYYFELEDTDYLNRRPYIENCTKEDFANCKIVEFIAVGVGSTCTRKFNFVNPSIEEATFRLFPKGSSNRFTYFACKSNFGVVKGGRKHEICFTFTPQELGAYEEFYQFHMHGKSPTTFLLAGQCREPHVYFKSPFITIEPTVLHVPKSIMVEIRNDEYQDCPFRLCKESLLDDDCKRRLEVLPMSGSIPPRNETSLKITYNAEEPGPVNFDVRCSVKNIKEPLHLGVSASCLAIFCKVMLKSPSVQKISIANEGTIGFYYTWQLDKNSANNFVDVSVEKEKGFLAGGTKTDSVLTLTPQRKTVIHDMKVILQVM
nr:unnamed protein product [Callosobruchus analis]